MPYSSIKVANEFLRLASASEPQKQFTPLQILKLVYITHGWSLHFFERPMLNERAQAWLYGPVVPTLYHAVKEYRARPISALIGGDYDPQALTDDDKQLISAVFNGYGHFSGTQLSNMTHAADTPWSRVWTTQGQNAVIPDDMIAQHYALLAERRNRGASGDNG